MSAARFEDAAAAARPPWWAVGLGAVFVAAGVVRRATAGLQADGRAIEDGRGRSATGPSEIPRRGWKDILWRLYQSISDDRILANAAGVAFYVLLAIFPGIAALVSIYGLFSDPSTIASHLDAASGIMPGGAIDIIRGQLTRLTGQGGTALGVGFVVGLAISLWSANSGTKALFDALNVVYEEKEQRGFITLNAISLCFTVVSLAFLLLAIAAVIALPVALNNLPLANVTGAVVSVARWPILLVLVELAFAAVYRYGPSRTEPRWQWVSWGAAVAALLWIAASLLFSWYAANFGSFNKTYGSLGAVVGFMMWIWLSTIVVLVGGKLNAEIEHQTARTTTVGGPKPLGSRGARMADTIGRRAD
jgi:membrane protein